MRNKIYTLFIAVTLSLPSKCYSSTLYELTQPFRIIKHQLVDINLRQTCPAWICVNTVNIARSQTNRTIKSRFVYQVSEVPANQTFFQLYEAPLKKDNKMVTEALVKAQDINHQFHLLTTQLLQLQPPRAVHLQGNYDTKATTMNHKTIAHPYRKKFDLPSITVSIPGNGRIATKFLNEKTLVNVNNIQALPTIQQITDIYVKTKLNAFEVNMTIQDLSKKNMSFIIINENGLFYTFFPKV